MHRVQFTAYCVQFTVYRVQFTVHRVQFTVHRVQFTVYRVQFTVYSLPCTVYRVQFTVYRVQFTVPCTVNVPMFVHCTMHRSSAMYWIVQSKEYELKLHLITVLGVYLMNIYVKDSVNTHLR